MSIPPTERTLRRTIPSSLDAYRDVIDSVLEGLGELGWQRSDLFGVEMALEESLSNAIRHGNKQDASKQVDFECEMASNRFFARITDQGEGFEPSSVPDCCAPDRLEAPGGRGLALIRAYMTQVEYNAQGNCITLEKTLPSRNDGKDHGPRR